MNTFSNFGSFNGRMLPGSGWGEWGGGPDMYFVDCNGEVWIPCVCGENGDETGATGAIEATGAAEATGAGSGSAGEGIQIVAGLLQYIPNRNGAFVQVQYPGAILHYAGQTYTLDGAQYDKGMLADTDKGRRYAYRGTHTGRVRLHIAQSNRTDAKAVLEDGEVKLLEGVYPAEALHYGICFAAKERATVTILRQGASIGGQGNNAALKEYLRFAQEPQTFAVAAGGEQWLFLGRQEARGGNGGELRFLAAYERRARIGTEPRACFVEAQLDIEIIGEAEIVCCAFHDFSRVDLNGSMQPMPMLQANNGLTGVRHRFWGFEGMYAWQLDDNSNATSIALEAREESEPFEVLASRDPWPLNEHNLDQILFYPPMAAPARELREAGGSDNRGVVYHQVFVLRNEGELPRRVNYYIESEKGGEVTLALSQGQVISFRTGEAPQLVAAAPNIAPHGKKITESWHVHGAGAEFTHVLRADEAG